MAKNKKNAAAKNSAKDMDQAAANTAKNAENNAKNTAKNQDAENNVSDCARNCK